MQMSRSQVAGYKKKSRPSSKDGIEPVYPAEALPPGTGGATHLYASTPPTACNLNWLTAQNRHPIDIPPL